MPDYEVDIDVSYSGRETVRMTVTADSFHEALEMAQDDVDDGMLAYRNIYLSIDGAKIISCSDDSEVPPPRCDQTKDLFS